MLGEYPFFKIVMKFYVNKKATDIQKSLTSFEQEYVKKQGNMQNNQNLERKYFINNIIHGKQL